MSIENEWTRLAIKAVIIARNTAHFRSLRGTPTDREGYRRDYQRYHRLLQQLKTGEMAVGAWSPKSGDFPK